MLCPRPTPLNADATLVSLPIPQHTRLPAQRVRSPAQLKPKSGPARVSTQFRSQLLVRVAQESGRSFSPNLDSLYASPCQQLVEGRAFGARTASRAICKDDALRGARDCRLSHPWHPVTALRGALHQSFTPYSNRVRGLPTR
jgi:hypothetical protein